MKGIAKSLLTIEHLDRDLENKYVPLTLVVEVPSLEAGTKIIVYVFNEEEDVEIKLSVKEDDLRKLIEKGEENITISATTVEVGRVDCYIPLIDVRALVFVLLWQMRDLEKKWLTK